jgi:hypothetical protein
MNAKEWIENNSEKLIQEFYDSSEYHDIFENLQSSFESFVNEKIQVEDNGLNEVEIFIIVSGHLKAAT